MDPAGEQSRIQEVAESERQYENGADPKVLDIIDIPLLKHQPDEYQRENWLLDPQYYWRRVGQGSWHKLIRFSDMSGTLWHNGSSTYHGQNDRVSLTEAATETSSLKLIHVHSLRLKVFAPGREFGDIRRRVQAMFSFDGTSYALRVTDPYIERRFLSFPDGEHDLPEAFLTISLGEPFKEHCYKLVAAIISRLS